MTTSIGDCSKKGIEKWKKKNILRNTEMPDTKLL